MAAASFIRRLAALRAAWRGLRPRALRPLPSGALLLGLLLLGTAVPVARGEEEATWQSSVSGLHALGVDALRIHPKNPGVIYANVHGLGASRSSNGGVEWTKMMTGVRPLPGPRDACRIALDESSPKTLYLVTMGQVYRSVNSGEDWDNITSGELASFTWDKKRSLYLIYELVVDPGKSVRLLAGTRTDGKANGGLFESTNSGKTWEQLAGSNILKSELGPDAWLIALDESTDKNVLVGGGSALYFSDKRGRQFKRVDPGGVGIHEFHDMTGVLPGSKDVFACDRRGVWQGREVGKSWGNRPLLEGDAVTVASDLHSRKRLFAVLRDRGLVVSDDARHARWEDLGHAELEITGLYFHPKEPKWLYAASLSTGLHLSKDEGKTFEAVAGNVPIVVPGIVAVEVHPGEGNVHLCLTEDGRVFASKDRANSWTRVGRLGMTPTLLRADPSAPGAWLAAGSRLMASADGGAKWETIYRPDDAEDRIVALERGPDGALHLLLERGLRVVSSPDGKTWTASEPITDATNAWASSLAVDARNAAHMLVAARTLETVSNAKDAEGGAYETWDGGKTWAATHEGLFNPKDAKVFTPDWNRGRVAGIDPVSGMLYYGADEAGLFARPSVPPPTGGAKAQEPEAWVAVGRWEVQNPVIRAFLLRLAANGTDSELIVQAEGDADTRALVRASGNALAEARIQWRAGNQPDGVPWAPLKDPLGAVFSSLRGDPSAPERLLGSDRLGARGVLVFEKAGTAPPAPGPGPDKPPEPTVEPAKPKPPAGLLAFSGSGDQTIRVWSLAEGKAKTDLRGHTAEVFAVALAPDESVLVSGGADKTLRVWNAADGKELGTIPTDSALNALLFGIDPKHVFAAAEESWSILDVDLEAKTSRRFEGHTGAVLALAVTKDGTRVYSGGRDRTVRAWDAKEGKEVEAGKRFDFPGEVLALAVSPDGTRLYVAGKDKFVRVYCPQSWNEVGQASLPDPFARALALSPDGKTLYVAAEGAIRVLNAEDMTLKREMKGPAKAVLSIAVSADGKWIVAGDEENGLWMWADGDVQPQWSNPGAHTGAVMSVVLTPDVDEPRKPAEPAPGDK
jgi:photosystem II stability/assembly factor-like uncharacterized protein